MRIIEPKHCDTFMFPYKKDRYGISIVIGSSCTCYEYQDYVDDYKDGLAAWDYLLIKFWRYLGAA